MIRKGFVIYTRAILVTLAMLLTTFTIMAQEGHPLDGTWSGERIVDGEKIRLLLIMKLLPDQTFDATMIEGGGRIALNDISLNPEDWSVTLTVDGETRRGDPVNYKVVGLIENLGSVSERTITGTWAGGGESGPFRVVMN